MVQKTYVCTFSGKEEIVQIPRGRVVPDAPEGWLVVSGHLVAPDVELKLVSGDKEILLQEAPKPKPKRKREGKKGEANEQ